MWNASGLLSFSGDTDTHTKKAERGRRISELALLSLAFVRNFLKGGCNGDDTAV